MDVMKHEVAPGEMRVPTGVGACFVGVRRLNEDMLVLRKRWRTRTLTESRDLQIAIFDRCRALRVAGSRLHALAPAFTFEARPGYVSMLGSRLFNAAKAFLRLARDNPHGALKPVTRAAKTSALGTLYVRQKNGRLLMYILSLPQLVNIVCAAHLFAEHVGWINLVCVVLPTNIPSTECTMPL